MASNALNKNTVNMLSTIERLIIFYLQLQKCIWILKFVKIWPIEVCKDMAEEGIVLVNIFQVFYTYLELYYLFICVKQNFGFLKKYKQINVIW